MAHARAERVFIDGTTSSIIPRDPGPLYVSFGRGAYVTDIDGRTFLDLSGNFGTLVHGHAFPPVVEAVQAQMARGSCFTGPTVAEIELAEILVDRIPAAQAVRFTCSGTEAVSFAIKVARAVTGRTAIAKIEGAYHGSNEWAEVSQASSRADWGSPDAPAAVAACRGTARGVLDDVVVFRFNDAAGVARLIEENAHRLAAVLFDPLPSRLGFIPPDPRFLDAVRSATAKQGILLIVDEVLNFRLSYHGCSPLYDLDPDLITLGKLIGGGLPIGAIVGKKETMGVFSSVRQSPAVVHGGTFTANVLSMVAGVAAMRALDHATFARLQSMGDQLRRRLRDVVAHHRVPFVILGEGSLFRIHAKQAAPSDYREGRPTAAEQRTLSALSHAFAAQGILLPVDRAPALSVPMTQDDLDRIVAAFEQFIRGNSSSFNSA
jgi:glutamate-1-semialdehyde 2,1-aminomutase